MDNSHSLFFFFIDLMALWRLSVWDKLGSRLFSSATASQLCFHTSCELTSLQNFPEPQKHSKSIEITYLYMMLHFVVSWRFIYSTASYILHRIFYSDSYLPRQGISSAWAYTDLEWKGWTERPKHCLFISLILKWLRRRQPLLFLSGHLGGTWEFS